MRTSRLAALLVVPVAVFAAGCGSSSSGGAATGSAQVSPSAIPTATNANGCTPAPALQKTPQSYSSEPPLTISPTTYTATIVTNCGTIVVALDGKDAPHTVNSFNFLASKGFFNDTPCHRLTTAEAGIDVLQCGDPTGTGSGGPGYEFQDENLKGATYPAGTVAMANSGANTNGSQFFLVYGKTPLPPKYTPFGHIVSGLDVVQRIAAAGTDNSNGYAGDGRPIQPVVIESFTVTKGAPAA
ncbi:MAG TPA: peptidylprolyl isomerase [Mycobacteriales bacterium]|nr:peptidylprolyl isomerase [Mycobacteriales bacterium]